MDHVEDFPSEKPRAAIPWPVLQFLGGLAIAGLVAYFTAQNKANERVAVVETSERNHFEEVLRAVGEIKQSVKDLGAEIRQARDERRSPAPSADAGPPIPGFADAKSVH